MAYFPPTGSVLAFQASTWPGSVLVNNGSVVTYSSVPSSMLVGASIIGLTPVTAVITGNPSISGTVNIGIIPGSVISFQGGGWATSLISTVPSSVLTGASIFGQLPAGTAVLGSVATLQGTNPWIQTFSNSSILATQQGTHIASVISSTPSSMLVGASIFGMLPSGTQPLGSVATLQGTNPWIVSGSVMLLNSAGVIGSVTALQGTNPYLVSFANSSILATQQGTRITSVIGSTPSSLLTGNYAHRNDAIASFLGGNLTWNPLATDSAGRTIIKPFSSEDGTIISYNGSVVSASVQLISASVIGQRKYVTDFWGTSTGSSTLVTLQGGDASVLGYIMVPATNTIWIQGLNIPLKTTLSQDLAFKVAPAVSILYLTLKGYQAP